MKYPYIVNKNGVWYPSGTDVPEDIQKPKEEKPQYTKTDINRMSVDELRKMAMNTGVEGADTMTGKELKEYLCSVLNL